MKTLFLITLLLIPAFGQRTLTPVRVQIIATVEESGEEVADDVRARLRGLGYLVMTDSRPDWRIVLAASRDKCGYIGALVVMDARGKSELSIHTAPDARALGGQIAGKLETEYFSRR